MERTLNELQREVDSLKAKIRFLENESSYKKSFSGKKISHSRRVQEILLVANPYDSFILEEDYQFGEKILGQYAELNLYYVPRVTKVSSTEKAYEALAKFGFDLVITMPRIGDSDAFEFSKTVKNIRPELPIVLLIADDVEYEVNKNLLFKKDVIDKIFLWNGDSNIIIAIIKVIEDGLNAEYDFQKGHSSILIVVEDSIKFYSSFLPEIYIEIFKLKKKLLSDGLNELEKLLKVRNRPKIILVNSYEEAIAIFRKYQGSVMGIISDVSMPRNGKMNKTSGIELAKHFKSYYSDLPMLLCSTEVENREIANNLLCSFIDKNSPSLHKELIDFMENQLGFGDFVFRTENGVEVGRASNVTDLERIIEDIPEVSVLYHAKRNHFSNWLMARGEFHLAKKFRPVKVGDLGGKAELVKSYIVEAIRESKEEKKQNVIIDFEENNFSLKDGFVRLSSGSLGGKARGVAFMRYFLRNHFPFKKFPKVKIKLPFSVVVGTDEFDSFIKNNNLYKLAISSKDDNFLIKKFLGAKLSKELVNKLKIILAKIENPLAVRSSSILEDSRDQPFAGIYSTIMIPNNEKSFEERLKNLCKAIKLVYASTYFENAKNYMEGISLRFEEEKMAVLIQEIVGIKHQRYFYPTISGVAESYNYYATGHAEQADGTANIALGLGEAIVEGCNTLQFSPKYPNSLIQFSSVQDILKNSQNTFFALDLEKKPKLKNEKDYIKRLGLEQAEKDDVLAEIASTYSNQDGRIYNGIRKKGARLVTFANILKYNTFPLAEILVQMLKVGKKAMNSDIQIEFAVNLDKDSKAEFNLLQIRPFIAGREKYSVSISKGEIQKAFCISSNSLGNGIQANLKHFVYVKPKTFSSFFTHEIATELGKLNHLFREQNTNYVLLGFGRWGTSDSWLGIPVRWSQISNAKVIIETNLDDFNISASYGTHFFQNLISNGSFFFNIDTTSNGNEIDWEVLENANATYETDYIRCVEFPQNLKVKVDGRTKQAVILQNE